MRGLCRVGGPRCSSHANSSYNKAFFRVRKAVDELAAARVEGDPAATAIAAKRVQAELTRLQEARDRYDTTVGGLTQLATHLERAPDEESLRARFQAGYRTRLEQLQAHDIAEGKPARASLNLTIGGNRWNVDATRQPTAQELADAGFTVIRPDDPDRSAKLRAALGLTEPGSP